MTAAGKFTAREMNRALWSHFIARWAVLTEVTARAKHEPFVPGQPRDPNNRDRRIDVLLVRPARGGQAIERLAIEIKVTRADFRQDINNPAKQAPWRELAHRHAYAVPEGLVDVSEVPADSGLLVVKRAEYGVSGFSVRWARQAKKPAGHDPGDLLPMSNLMDAFWRTSRAEAQIKGYGTGYGLAGVDDPDELRAQLLQVKGELERTGNRLARESEAKERWQKAFAAMGDPPCGTCGKPLRLMRRRYGVGDWEHRAAEDESACRPLRKTKDDEFSWVDPPLPAELPDGVSA